MAQQHEKQNGRQLQDKQDGRTIEVKTLIIAAIAAAVAAVVTSFFWKRGTLISTAVTPVIVALTQEALRRPAEKVSSAASKVTPVRGVGALAGVGASHTPDAGRFDERRLMDRERQANGGSGNGATEGGAPPPPFDDTRSYDPARSAGAGNGDTPGDTAPAAAAGDAGERKVYGRRRFRWKVALVTGIAAFAIAAAVLTISELALGESVGGDGRTSLFSADPTSESGSTDPSDDAESSEDPTSEEAVPSDSSESAPVPEEEPAPPEEEPAPVEEEPAEPVEPQSVPAPSE